MIDSERPAIELMIGSMTANVHFDDRVATIDIVGGARSPQNFRAVEGALHLLADDRTAGTVEAKGEGRVRIARTILDGLEEGTVCVHRLEGYDHRVLRRPSTRGF